MILNQCQIKASKKLELFLDNYIQDRFYILEGSAGTGKSTLITNLLGMDKYSEKKIVFTATTNKAVSVLEQLSVKKDYSFLTIHKLLNIKRIIDKSGKESYQTILDNDEKKIKKSKSIFFYDIIIIDEVSMISEDILYSLMKVKDKIKGKVIFVGDSAQLPPVNEDLSNIFKMDNINKVVLNEIMRYKGNIVGLANEIRELVFDNKRKINFSKFKNEDLKIYKDNDKFVNSYLTKIKKIKKLKKENEGQLPIIIAYTNKRCDELNKIIRSNLFSNTKERFEVGELIIFNEYYYLNKKSFYTSQTAFIKYINIDYVKIDTLNLPDKFLSLENNIINKNIESVIELLRDIRIKIYNITLNCNSEIYVIHEDNLEIYEDLVEKSKKIIKKNNTYIEKKYRNSNIYRELSQVLWDYLYEKLIDLFADINYGYVITTHKSQGSNYDNVFVDMNNIILKNPKKIESFKCLYTAITRTSKKLYINI